MLLINMINTLTLYLLIRQPIAFYFLSLILLVCIQLYLHHCIRINDIGTQPQFTEKVKLSTKAVHSFVSTSVGLVAFAISVRMTPKNASKLAM